MERTVYPPALLLAARTVFQKANQKVQKICPCPLSFWFVDLSSIRHISFIGVLIFLYVVVAAVVILGVGGEVNSKTCVMYTHVVTATGTEPTKISCTRMCRPVLHPVRSPSASPLETFSPTSERKEIVEAQMHRTSRDSSLAGAQISVAHLARVELLRNSPFRCPVLASSLKPIVKRVWTQPVQVKWTSFEMWITNKVSISMSFLCCLALFPPKYSC